MKKFTFLYSLLFVLLTISSCNDDDNFQNVELRIHNASELNYENVSVLSFELEGLTAGEYSEYRTFDMGYEMISFFLEIDGREYRQQVIDYVGEEPLRRGRYTYVLDFDEINDVVMVNLIEE